MDIIKKIAEELQIKATQAEAAVKLIDEGCTIPFIARYRKEATGALNDEQLRNLDERLRSKDQYAEYSVDLSGKEIFQSFFCRHICTSHSCSL